MPGGRSGYTSGMFRHAIVRPPSANYADGLTRVDLGVPEFERVLAINLKSVFYGCQAAIRVMGDQGSGNIVNISSGAIDTAAPTLACYGMTKAAVR